MSATEPGAQSAPAPGALCVSIHDVAPATWPDCLRLASALRAVADIPLTWLVVPRYHGSAARSAAMEHALGTLLEQGHELALHGYTHLDDAPLQGPLHRRLLRTVYTQSEGEFAALAAGEARRRIELGLDWFAQRGWPVTGFVAPAWLVGEAVWPVLRALPFEYTTTMGRFHLLGPGAPRALFSPSLVYAARNASGRVLSPPLASAMAALLAGAPLVRFGLHPRDARHPALVRHAQQLVERLLAARTASTKAAFAHRLAAAGVSSITSTDPNSRARGTDKPGSS